MLFWFILIYLLLGIIVNIIQVIKEPIILYVGFWLIPYFILGVVIFPYIIYLLLKPSYEGRWI